MSFVDLLSHRVSIPKLRAPAPNDEVMSKCYQAAMRAPDHGRLKPWRFIEIRDQGLEALGHLFFEAELQRSKEISEVREQKLKSMPLRAPLMVVVVAQISQHPKVPREEQLMAAACAAYGLSMALYSEGYGCMWRTGELAYDPYVKRHLGLSDQEEVIGYMYIGTADCTPKTPKADNQAEFVSHWSGTKE